MTSRRTRRRAACVEGDRASLAVSLLTGCIFKFFPRSANDSPRRTGASFMQCQPSKKRRHGGCGQPAQSRKFRSWCCNKRLTLLQLGDRIGRLHYATSTQLLAALLLFLFASAVLPFSVSSTSWTASIALSKDRTLHFFLLSSTTKRLFHDGTRSHRLFQTPLELLLATTVDRLAGCFQMSCRKPPPLLKKPQKKPITCQFAVLTLVACL